MPRLLPLLTLALLATAAHAQSDAISAVFDAHNAEYGVEPVAGPFIGQFVDDGEGDDSTWEVDLEGGVAYMLFLATAPGSDLDPDAAVYDADDNEVVVGFEPDETEMIWFTPETSGTYRVQVAVCCEGGAMPFGAALYLDGE